MSLDVDFATSYFHEVGLLVGEFRETKNIDDFLEKVIKLNETQKEKYESRRKVV